MYFPLVVLLFRIGFSEKIGIIGGGVSGHYLAKILSENGDEITIYESSSHECGRVHTIVQSCKIAYPSVSLKIEKNENFFQI